jgi:hypothetical protein
MIPVPLIFELVTGIDQLVPAETPIDTAGHGVDITVVEGFAGVLETGSCGTIGQAAARQQTLVAERKSDIVGEVGAQPDSA